MLLCFGWWTRAYVNKPSVVQHPSGGGFIWYGIGGLFESEPSSSSSSSFSARPVDISETSFKRIPAMRRLRQNAKPLSSFIRPFPLCPCKPTIVCQQLLCLQVQLWEDGPGNDGVRSERSLDGVMEDLLEARGPQLARIGVPHWSPATSTTFLGWTLVCLLTVFWCFFNSYFQGLI